MNKKLIALAVAGATVAPAAMAQTANPVTLYGRVYVTMEYVESKGTGGVPSRARVENQASLLGVRGTEDLGGGLKAFFQLETSFRPDQNNSGFADRNSGVGFQGNWGSFVVGRWDTPFKTATTAIDPFGDLTLGGITGVLNDGGNFDRRDQNMVQYWSPSLGGFAFRLMATANENKGSACGTNQTCNARDYGANLTWTRGPIYLFGTWEQHKDNNSAVAVGSPTTSSGGSAVAGVPGYEEEGFALGGSFAFGPVKLGGQYQQIEKTGRKDIEAWMANIVWTLGNHQFIAQYMQSENGGLNAVSNQPECQSYNLGWQYNFSRRTFLLTQYTEVDNENAATCNFGANRLTTPAGTDPKGFSIGIRHVF